MKKRIGIILGVSLFLAVGLTAITRAQEQAQMPMGGMGTGGIMSAQGAPGMPTMMCPMMGNPMTMMGGPGGDAKMMGRGMRLRGEMMQKMGEVMMQYGKMMEEGPSK